MDDDGKPCSKVKRNPFRIRGNISGVKETLSAKSRLDPESVWNGLRPIQRRELLELSLSEKEFDNPDIQESLNFIVFRKFNELKPDLKKSIKFMLGG